jgi:two-component system sensor kinase FixL
MRVADGSYRVCRARAAPRRDESGRIIRWYGYTEDIHERQQMEAARQEAEERLRESEELYRQTVELSQGIVWTAAADGAFESMTRRYWDLTGMEPGTLPRNAIHPDDRERVLGEWANAIATGTPHNTEYRLRLADGSYRQYRARAAPRRDEHGQIVRWYGLLEDIDEQKQSERAQEEAEAEIRRVQSELIHVSRLSAMGAMASALAHELNQPLTAVSSYLRGSRRLLQQVSDPTVDKVMDALQAAEEGALRAGQMVRRLRELVSRGSVSTRAEHLPKLIQDANTIGFVDEMLFGVTHKVELDPAAEWVEVDPIQIQQVLINLIRNAIQAMEDQPRREISITTRASSRNTAEVSVADTGCGIPEEVREALFSPFQSSKADGMGIGLSISRTIIEAHGGKIWAEDREGGGTVFRFTLRIADAPDAREEGEAAA